MRKVKNVIIFKNGNIVVFDTKGQQISELQVDWVNFEALKKLAKVIAKDDPAIEGEFPPSYNPLMGYVQFYKEQSK